MQTSHLVYLLIACAILFTALSIKNEGTKKRRQNRKRHPMDRIEWLGSLRSRMQDIPCTVSLYELNGEEFYHIYAQDKTCSGIFSTTVYKADGSVLFYFIENQTAENHIEIEDFYRKAVFTEIVWDHLLI